MIKTFVFKLYHSKRNKHLHHKIDIASEIYNHCIELHKRYYRITGKYINLFRLFNHLAKLRKMIKFNHWRQIDAQAIQNIAERIDRAYRKFFKSIKKNPKIKASPPSFKKRSKYKSFTFKQSGYKLLEGNRIRLQGRIYKYFKSRNIEGKIKTVTVKRDRLGDVYLYFSCEVEKDQQNKRTMTGKIAGFDFGLKTFLTSSDGSEIESPLFFKKASNTIRIANQNLSHKKKGSNNRKRALLNLVRAHKCVENRRKDYHFKLANNLIKQYDYLFFENLNIQPMQKLWGKKISDLGFSQFLVILEYVASRDGSTVGMINRFYPSTKECSVCGFINNDLSLKYREWECPKCKTYHHRDRNAANNILRVGTSTLGVGGVRLPLKEAFSVDTTI